MIDYSSTDLLLGYDSNGDVVPDSAYVGTGFDSPLGGSLEDTPATGSVPSNPTPSKVDTGGILSFITGLTNNATQVYKGVTSPNSVQQVKGQAQAQAAVNAQKGNNMVRYIIVGGAVLVVGLIVWLIFRKK